MPKDNRKIHSGVRHEGTTYTAGMEDELSESMSQKQLDRLAERGAISGDWTGLAEDVDDDPVQNEGNEAVTKDDTVSLGVGSVAKTAKPATEKSAAKKSSSKKSAAKK